MCVFLHVCVFHSVASSSELARNIKKKVSLELTSHITIWEMMRKAVVARENVCVRVCVFPRDVCPFKIRDEAQRCFRKRVRTSA